MGIEKFKADLETVMKKADGTKVNIAYGLWDVLLTAPQDQKAELMEFVANTWDDAKSSDEVIISEISRDEEDDFRKRFGEVSDTLLKALVRENYAESRFYGKLYDYIASPFFSTQKEQAFVLYNILIDRMIPYFEISDGMSMSNPDFHRYKDEYRAQLKKIEHIMARDFDQKTKKASNILDVIEGVEDKNAKVVLMGAVINSTKGGDIGKLRGLMEMVKDL